jgi:MFS transporter, PAT family, solute carrier family 33 (acetyl-CoA transportor), member 1
MKSDSKNSAQKRKPSVASKMSKPQDLSTQHGELPSHSKFQDYISISILILLYTLQGIPMGLSGSIPLILKEKGASYEALSLFSLVSVPFSLKLLWAPLVDCYYLKSFGRRKTWLIPVQFVTGIVMIFGSSFIGPWLEQTDAHGLAEPAIGSLTLFFVSLYFLMATQDIAVDGWALTMLSRERVGYASVCNGIGQVLGVFVANQGFIALSDEKWCHKHLGITASGGLITLPGFMLFWGYVFVIVTVLIWLFKKEEPVDASDHPSGLLETCNQVISVIRLPAVQTFAFVLLTGKAAFAPSDAVFGFKLQVRVLKRERGAFCH